MIRTDQYEKANFRALIEKDGLGDVEDRLNVIDLFLDIENHVTLEELMGLLRERGCDYDPHFMRQCMNRWVEHGFAQKKRFEGQPPRYEHRHLGKHHDHLICTKCGRIEEFWNEEMERLQLRIATAKGFHMLQHKMEIYGLCNVCMAQRRFLIPLAMAKPGEKIIVKEMLGGRTARSRLASMGFRPGDVLEVINNNGQGRLIVGHECTRLAIGRGMAQKIMVSLAPADKIMPCHDNNREGSA